MSKSDMFFSLAGQRSGPVKGESQDEAHKGEIDIVGWSWGIEAQAEMAGSGLSGKATVKQLRLLKHVDCASTALMILAANNELIKKALLTVRKAGTAQQEYFKLTIEKGRITSYDVQAPQSEANPEMLEVVTIAFQKIEVEYRTQGADGQLKGGALFVHEII